MDERHIETFSWIDIWKRHKGWLFFVLGRDNDSYYLNVVYFKFQSLLF